MYGGNNVGPPFIIGLLELLRHGLDRFLHVALLSINKYHEVVLALDVGLTNLDKSAPEVQDHIFLSQSDREEGSDDSVLVFINIEDIVGLMVELEIYLVDLESQNIPLMVMHLPQI